MPNNVAALRNRGKAFLFAGNYKQAIADFSEMIRLNPTSYAGFAWRGFAHFEFGSNDAGLSDYREALRLEPEFYRVWPTHSHVVFGGAGKKRNVRIRDS
jgi:tetratricopeptide (TPR) repeat protein